MDQLSKPVLVIFSGLPGVGKSGIAKLLAERLGAAYLRADTIEQAMRNGGMEDIGGLGYGVGYAVATENLRLGRNVVADSVNPWPLTREAWRSAAKQADCRWLDVEVVCGDVEEHRRRVENRDGDVEGLVMPTWDEVQARDYRPWDTERLVLDTCSQTPETAGDRILQAIEAMGKA